MIAYGFFVGGVLLGVVIGFANGLDWRERQRRQWRRERNRF